jgi:hypothetical protein
VNSRAAGSVPRMTTTIVAVSAKDTIFKSVGALWELSTCSHERFYLIRLTR